MESNLERGKTEAAIIGVSLNFQKVGRKYGLSRQALPQLLFSTATSTISL